MGIFDWLIIVFLVFLMWRGWRKGFIGMLLQLVGIILVFFLVSHYYPLVRQGLMVKLQAGYLTATILAVILIVALIALIVHIIRLILERTVKAMSLSFLNSSIGALLGFLCGVIFMVVLSTLIEIFPVFANKLENSTKHRVYAAVRVVRTEMYSALKLDKKLQSIKESTLEKLPDLPKIK